MACVEATIRSIDCHETVSQRPGRIRYQRGHVVERMDEVVKHYMPSKIMSSAISGRLVRRIRATRSTLKRAKAISKYMHIYC